SVLLLDLLLFTSIVIFSTRRHPPYSTLFPYTTLFRSSVSEIDFRERGLWLASAWGAQSRDAGRGGGEGVARCGALGRGQGSSQQDRKSTRLNSSHVKISYAVFCLKKKIFKESLFFRCL